MRRRKSKAKTLENALLLVPTLRRGNAIPRRSGVAEVLTNVIPCTCAGDAGASTKHVHTRAWEQVVFEPCLFSAILEKEGFFWGGMLLTKDKGYLQNNTIDLIVFLNIV
jgi:hypothetical protein